MKIFYFLLIILISDSVLAKPAYLKNLPPALKKCRTCHKTEGGKGFNPFGRDFSRTLNIQDILTIDSDEDGFTNSQELKAETFPGDHNSYPGGKFFLSPFLLFILFIFSLFTFILILFFILKKRKKGSFE